MSTTINSFFDRQKLDLSDKSKKMMKERRREREQFKYITQ